MRDNNGADSITLTWEIPHPPAKVWRALTETDLLSEWIMATDLKLEIGYKFTFRQAPTPWWDGIVNCEILEIEPNKKLAYSWKAQPGNDGKFQLDTVVIWSLIPSGQGTTLSLTQTGFQPNNKQAFAGAKAGWDRNVTTLTNILNQESL